MLNNKAIATAHHVLIPLKAAHRETLFGATQPHLFFVNTRSYFTI